MTKTGDEGKTIQHILTHCRTIAVVGLSANPARPSYGVAQYMQAHGYRIIPINPNETEILGERCYPSLTAAASQEKFDLVNCFRNSSDIPPIVDEAIALAKLAGIQAIWMQQGITQLLAAAKAEAAGLTMVQDRCLKIEHRLL
jgi:predicted CoA-binding protein